jgi:hypothetical protein
MESTNVYLSSTKAEFRNSTRIPHPFCILSGECGTGVTELSYCQISFLITIMKDILVRELIRKMLL